MKMTELEKAIKGMELCLTPVDYYEDGTAVCHDECPYFRDYAMGDCLRAMCRDALALMKAQEPRVETWEEAQANVQGGPFIIFEVRDSTGSEVDFGVLEGDYYEMSEGSVLTVVDFGMMKDDYGKRFRLWTSRPTDEQREAEVWND
jgi:hypothetical protein